MPAQYPSLYDAAQMYAQQGQGRPNLAAFVTPPKTADAFNAAKLNLPYYQAQLRSTNPFPAIDTTANNIGEGIAKGVMGGFQLGGYFRRNRENQAALEGYGNQLQQAQEMAQAQMMEGQKRELAQLQFKRELALRDPALGSTPDERALNFDRSLASDGKLQENAYSGIGSGIGTTQGNLAGNDAKAAAFQQATGHDLSVFNTGQATPQLRETYKGIYGGYPEDQIDFKDRNLTTQGKQASLQGQLINNQYSPTEKQVGITGGILSNQSAELGNKLKQIQLAFEPKNQEADLRNKYLTTEERTKKLADAQEGNRLISEFTTAIEQGKTYTPQDLISLQSRLNMLAGKDSNITGLIKDLVNPKAGHSIGSKEISKVLPNSAGQTTQGGLVQLPSGLWYNPQTRQVAPNPQGQEKQASAPKAQAKPSKLIDRYGNTHSVSPAKKPIAREMSAASTPMKQVTYVDNYGNPHTLTQPLQPYEMLGNQAQDILGAVGNQVNRFLMNSDLPRENASLGGY